MPPVTLTTCSRLSLGHRGRTDSSSLLASSRPPITEPIESAINYVLRRALSPLVDGVERKQNELGLLGEEQPVAHVSTSRPQLVQVTFDVARDSQALNACDVHCCCDCCLIL